jgi:hypothetical protein
LVVETTQTKDVMGRFLQQSSFSNPVHRTGVSTLTTKKDIVFLLLPSVLVVYVAIYALHFSYIKNDSHYLANDSEFVTMRQQDFEDFVAKVQSGKLQLTSAEIIKLLRNHHEAEERSRTLIFLGSKITRVIGWVTAVAVILQAYVVLRFKAEYKRQIPRESLRPNAPTLDS